MIERAQQQWVSESGMIHFLKVRASPCGERIISGIGNKRSENVVDRVGN